LAKILAVIHVSRGEIAPARAALTRARDGGETSACGLLQSMPR
jgi:hypothetical protein